MFADSESIDYFNLMCVRFFDLCKKKWVFDEQVC